MKTAVWKKFRMDTRAVSPVVATLMLVLVAAGGAVGLNIWLKDFQSSATEDVATPQDFQSLSIDGSSTVYEFSLQAIPGFEAFMEQRGTPILVELEKGGSGAGRKAVGLCLVDIGSSSSSVPDSEKLIYPDCDGIAGKDFGKELQIFKVATDGVVFASLSSNAHCDDPATSSTVEVATLTRNNVLGLYYHNANNFGALDTTKFGSAPNTAEDLDGNSASADFTDVAGDVQWGEVPSTASSGWCNFGGANAQNVTVEIGDRSDPGGTSEIASEKLFGKKFGQLEDFGVTLNAAHQGDGNQGVLTAMKALTGKDDTMFFTSYGYAVANGLDVHRFGVTTADILAPSSSNIKDETYDATRPILYITAGTPDPVEQLWLDYVMNPHQNQLIAEAADFETIY